MAKPLKQVLIERDEMTDTEAEELIQECRDELMRRIGNGEYADDICEEYFGLEPDYLMDLI